MKNFFTSFKHFMSFWGNITKCQRPINNTCSEYSDGLKLIKEYRPELQKYITSILGINTLVKYHGLLTILDEYVLTKTGIGDGINMCGFGFPDTNDCEPSFFTKGVCFNYGYDTELEVISDQEFVWLIEDTCNMYLKCHPADAQQIDLLLNEIRREFAKS